jgi:hypothetical protein
MQLSCAAGTEIATEIERAIATERRDGIETETERRGATETEIEHATEIEIEIERKTKSGRAAEAGAVRDQDRQRNLNQRRTRRGATGMRCQRRGWHRR